MPHSKKLVFIVGSLRRGSFNRALAEYAAEVVGERAEVEYLDYADLPLMNEDIEFPAPAAVARIREQVESADGVWIFSPEYNFSYPAGLKNALDWLSRPQVAGDFDAAVSLTDMPVAISGAGGKRRERQRAPSARRTARIRRGVDRGRRGRGVRAARFRLADGRLRDPGVGQDAHRPAGRGPARCPFVAARLPVAPPGSLSRPEASPRSFSRRKPEAPVPGRI